MSADPERENKVGRVGIGGSGMLAYRLAPAGGGGGVRRLRLEEDEGVGDDRGLIWVFLL